MKRYKINIDREKLTEQEIQQQMDFDRFGQGIPPKKPWMKVLHSNRWITASVAGALVITGAWLFRSLNGENALPPFINPPITEANVRYESWFIDTKTDTTLMYKSGSTVTIPAGVFVDKEGKTVDGKIEIRYREFHDPFEVILSGIPMHYDSAGIRYQFESAGMVELLAFKNGEPVNVMPGGFIPVNMVSRNTDDKFNLYYLDTAKQCWNYVSESSRKTHSNLPLFDSIREKEYLEKVAGIREPVRPAIARPGAYRFSIDYKKEEFPELAIYDSLQFEIDRAETTFNPSLASKTWEDVSIRKEEGKFIVTFSKENESHSFAVAPVTDGNNYEETMKAYNRKLAEYTIALEARKNSQLQNEEVMRATYEKYVAEARWEDLNSRVRDYLKRDPVNYRTLTIRTFNITEVGVWNCDWPFQFANPVSEEFTFQNSKKIPHYGFRAYLIERGRNAMYELTYNKSGKARARYDKEKRYILLVFTEDGRPAIMNENAVSDVLASVNGERVFTLEPIPGKIKTPEELRKVLNL